MKNSADLLQILFLNVFFWAISSIFVWFVFFRTSSVEKQKADKYPTLFQTLQLLIAFILLSTSIDWSLLTLSFYFPISSEIRSLLAKVILWPCVFGLVYRKTRTGLCHLFSFSEYWRLLLVIPIAIWCWFISHFLNNQVQQILVLPNFFPMSELRIGPMNLFRHAVLVPIVEEMLFRGIILKGLLKAYRPWLAILISALIFSFAHVNPNQFLPTAIYGVVLGWIAYWLNSILPTIVMHMTINAFASLIGLTGLPAWFNLENSQMSGRMFVILTALSVTCIFAIIKIKSSFTHRNEVELQNRSQRQTPD